MKLFKIDEVETIEDFNKYTKHQIFLSVVSIACTLVVAVGVAFAWFSATVTGNDNASSVYVQTGTLGITYTDGSSTINMVNALPGDSANKTFTIAPSSGVTVEQNYKINWVITKNEFVKTTNGTTNVNNLKYTLAATDSNGGTHVSATNADVPETAGTSQIGSVGTLPVGKSHTYKLTLNFIDTGYEQDSNQGKEFVGKIEVASITA